jgi:hypothetical protein
LGISSSDEGGREKLNEAFGAPEVELAGTSRADHSAQGGGKVTFLQLRRARLVADGGSLEKIETALV